MFTGIFDLVSATPGSNVRLEVGTANRYAAGHTIQLNESALIINPVRFIQVAPVGGAHL
jgi:hypothetical protein